MDVLRQRLFELSSYEHPCSVPLARRQPDEARVESSRTPSILVELLQV